MEKVLSSRIKIDCVKNSKKNIKRGEPEYIGFDFDVRDDKYDEMVEYTRCCLTVFKVPFVSISFGGKAMIDEQYIFDKSRVFDSISNNADFVISCKKLRKKSSTM